VVTKVRVIIDGNPALMDIDALAPANVVIRNVPCDATVFIKAAVRMTIGGTAVNALADSATNANVIGIVEGKPTSTTCDIRVNGHTGSLFTGLDVTKLYFLSATIPGEMTIIAPTAPGTIRQYLGKPFSGTEFLVTIGSDPTQN